MSESSMVYWWQLIKDLPVPQPKTVIIPFNRETIINVLDGNMDGFKNRQADFDKAIDFVGEPFFIRTDILSGKHSWKETCYVPGRKDLLQHIYNLLEVNFMVFTEEPSAIVIREYIPLESPFKAFWGNMPVAKERRYFVRSDKRGKVQCHHPYWPEGAIRDPSNLDWRRLLRRLNDQIGEYRILSEYARMVAKACKGYWSVDFAKALDGRWLLIDMAEGDKSWHWPICRYNPDWRG